MEVLIQTEVADMIRVAVLNTIPTEADVTAAVVRLNMAAPTMTVAAAMDQVVHLNTEVLIPKTPVVTAAAVPLNMALRITIGAAVMEPVGLPNMEVRIPHGAAEARVPAAVLNTAEARISTIAAPVATIRTAVTSTTEVIPNTIAVVLTRTEAAATAPVLRGVMEAVRDPTRIIRAAQTNQATSIRIAVIQGITTPAAVPARVHPEHIIRAAVLMTSEPPAALPPSLEAVPARDRQAVPVRIRTIVERAILEQARPVNRAMTQAVRFTRVPHRA